jgi:hypothetical protein
MDSGDKTSSPAAITTIAERAIASYKEAIAEKRVLEKELHDSKARTRKAVAQAEKAIPMLKRYQAKLKQAVSANARLEERAREAEASAKRAEERARAAEEAAKRAEQRAEAATEHARNADERRRRAEEHASAIESKAAIEGRLRRFSPRRRAA